MRKFNFELPKHRLQLHLKLVKRRKPLLEEPILPTPSIVNKKYKTGTFVGRLGRYLADHKNIKSVFAGSFIFATLLLAFSPQSSNIQAQGSIDPIIAAQVNLLTVKGMQYPVENIKINQNYAFYHPALDFGGPKGTPIKPVTNGVVAYSGWDRSGYGNLVILAHPNGFDSYYAHLSKIEVKTGQVVDMSTEIGQMGATGRATGVHLHLEIHQKGVSINPLTILSR